MESVQRKPMFVSDSPVHRVVSSHVLKWMANPDAGTEAADKMRLLNRLPKAKRIPAAIAAGHDGYVVLDGNTSTIVNHVFFEVKNNGTEMHVYFVHTAPGHADKGFARTTVRELIRKIPGKFPKVKFLVVGNGGEAHVASISDGLKKWPGNLRIKPREDKGAYWFELTH